MFDLSSGVFAFDQGLGICGFRRKLFRAFEGVASSVGAEDIGPVACFPWKNELLDSDVMIKGRMRTHTSTCFFLSSSPSDMSGLLGNIEL